MIIRAIKPSDYNSWSLLYASYAEFYSFKQTKEMQDRVWSWLNDQNHEVKGLLAISPNGSSIGLAHYRPFYRPLAASVGGFLDDLFVQPSARGEHVGSLLIQAVADIGKEKNWSVIRWITAENNYRARNSYDKIACQTQWVTYDIKI